MLHLFGPAYVVAAVSLLVIAAVYALKGWPPHFPASGATVESSNLKDLFDHTLRDYKAGLTALDTNLSAQALVVATAVLVIIRRSDSLNFFGNSIPLSWLHAFIPILLLYLFMAYGNISHRLIASRMLGVQLACALSLAPQDAAAPKALRLDEAAAKCGTGNPRRELLRDAGWIDAWYISFIDTEQNISGIDRTYAAYIKTVMIIVLGTQIAAAHASTLAIVSIGCRRYFTTRYKRRLIWYYVLPLAPLISLGVANFLFAYGGPHRNTYQLYVVAVSITLMAFLLWLSVKIDSTSHPETLRCLRLRRQQALPKVDQATAVTASTT
ncbi:hypothetical protein HZZ13_01010 [Bradyrhizobium sp. CNPSo 4010]|uniref:Uncharacterized protein n=1 Tax=Bradyrhizobium agreste TaxID=2751811 RepID=A0ABS0PGT3_9BRAD|nr:hypothetical protein [Bradyrhizobium agreste]MBH5396396.1 hypothetical protein [Bradyrhizobium agreste]